MLSDTTTVCTKYYIITVLKKKTAWLCGFLFVYGVKSELLERLKWVKNELRYTQNTQSLFR